MGKKPDKKIEDKPKRGPGQPTSYDPKYVDEFLEYFSGDPYRIESKTIITKSGDPVIIQTEVANDFKTKAGFALKIGVYRNTLLNWEKAHPEFLSAYKKAAEWQENYLTVNSLKKLIDNASAIFIMKNILGWRDNKSIEHTGAEGGPIDIRSKPESDLDARIKELESKLK
jgi:hypothetical protein